MLDELQLFAKEFQRGRFFEAHEILEQPWRDPQDPRYHSNYLRGLIYIAAFFVHRQKGNLIGMQHMRDKATVVLAPFKDQVMPIAVAPLLAHLHAYPISADFPWLDLEGS